MKELSWQEWLLENKGSKPLNQLAADYSLYCQQYDDYWRCLTIPNGQTNFILQENGDYLLQENGDKIIWLING